MSSQKSKIAALRRAAESYAQADKMLGEACGGDFDPIACTVSALKKRNVDSLPPESVAAANGLESLVALHCELVTNYGMDTDDVRAVWFPILNAGTPTPPKTPKREAKRSLLGEKGVLPAEDGQGSPTEFIVTFDDVDSRNVVITPLGLCQLDIANQRTLPRDAVMELLI